jgi:hypothetical protein
MDTVSGIGITVGNLLAGVALKVSSRQLWQGRRGSTSAVEDILGALS